MPVFGETVYVPRKGRCQEVITKHIIDRGMESTIIDQVPSAMGKPITETQTQMLYCAYKDLPLVAKLLDFDGVLGIYREAGITATVPGAFTQLDALCKSWSDADLDKLTEMIQQGTFSETWWTDLHTPIDKMRCLIRLHYPLNQRRNIDFGTATKEARRAYSHVFNALTMDALPDIAKTLDVSLRWLLGLNADATIYSDRAAVENLYDYYTLLAPNRRTLITMILEGGAENG